MIRLILEITGDEQTGIGVELNAEADQPTPQEQLFAAQLGKTISDFLSGAPGQKPKEVE